MDDARLMRCFVAVFPGATRDEIRAVTFDMIPGWDSLRGVTLLAVLDEEFGLQIDLQQLMDLGTFDAVKHHLMRHGVTL